VDLFSGGRPVSDGEETATCEATVTVVDVTPPEITCPADVELECPADTSPAATGEAAATDTCDSAPVIGYSDTSSGTCPLVITRTWTVTDASGNSASCVQTITVVDTTPPTISVSVSPDVLWPPNHKMVEITATVTVGDVCDSEPTVVLTSIESNEPDNGKGNDIEGAEFGTEDYTFLLQAERDGSGGGRIYTITYTATDASGNSDIGSATVTVPHDQGKGKGKGKK